jgi:hypothetical protein
MVNSGCNILVHGSNARNFSCIAIIISTSKKHYVFLIIVYAYSSTKLEKRAEQVLLGSKGVGRKGRGGDRNDANNVYTYE